MHRDINPLHMATGNSKEPKAAKPAARATTTRSTSDSKSVSKSAATTGSPKTSQKTKPTAAEKPAARKAPAKGGKVTLDDIQLRAYYIGEARTKAGIPGDSEGDWLKAEQELKAEIKASKAPAPAKAAPKKSAPKKATGKTG